MDLPRNLHDCYFFYYSTCQKGLNCEYRHEPAALGHEESCKLWVEGKCLNRQCNFRHMKIEVRIKDFLMLKLNKLLILYLQKPRSATPCYWEEQPGGCRKPHCVFQHKQPKRQAQSVVPQNAHMLMLQPALHTQSPTVVVDPTYYAMMPRIL